MLRDACNIKKYGATKVTNCFDVSGKLTINNKFFNNNSDTSVCNYSDFYH